MVDKQKTARVLRQELGRGRTPSKPLMDDMVIPNHSGDHSAGKYRNTPTKDTDLVNKKYVDDNAGISLWEVDGTETQLKTADEIDMQSKKIINVTDPGNNQDAATKKYVDDNAGGGSDGSDHDIADHADTSATGTELNTLTDNSMADALHRHSELSAADGTPDAALIVNNDGNVEIVASGFRLNSGSSGAQSFEGYSGKGFECVYDTDGSAGTITGGSGVAFFTSYDRGGSAYTDLWFNSKDMLFRSQTNSGGSGIVFQTNGANERMRINKVGNVGIATNSPDAKLEVAGDIHLSNSGDLIVGSTTLTEQNIIDLLALLV